MAQEPPAPTTDHEALEAVQAGQYEATRAWLREQDAVGLYVLRRDLLRFCELITDDQMRRVGVVERNLPEEKS